MEILNGIIAGILASVGYLLIGLLGFCVFAVGSKMRLTKEIDVTGSEIGVWEKYFMYIGACVVLAYAVLMLVEGSDLDYTPKEYFLTKLVMYISFVSIPFSIGYWKK